MPTVEEIVEQIRADAGADFAFVLTRKGRLVTHRAPRDMPEAGRTRLVQAARPIVGTDRVVELALPREELVPYGGAGPVDVYLGVAAEQAIVCVVMATWADKIRVAPSLAAGLEAIVPLLQRGLPSARRKSARSGAVRGSPTSVPPAPARPIATPRAAPSPDAIRITLASMPDDVPAAERTVAEQTAQRLTVPWVEPPGDAKRAADAEGLGRKLAPPDVTLEVAEADGGIIEEAGEELGAKPAARQPTMAFDTAGPPPTEKPASPRLPQRTLGFDSGAPVLPPLPAKPGRR